jgi:hypothetical protein
MTCERDADWRLMRAQICRAWGITPIIEQAIKDLEPVANHGGPMAAKAIRGLTSLISGGPTSPKPSWDDAPDWAEWLAQDSDGRWVWYGLKPGRMDINGTGRWFSVRQDTKRADIHGFHNPNWRDTDEESRYHYAVDGDSPKGDLERRPLPPCECGGEAWVYDDNPGHCVECKECFTMVMRPTESKARRAWRKLMGGER